MKHYLIAGADQGVGKTYVICALLRALKAAGVSAAGFKPVTCGDRTEVREMRDAMQEPTLSLELLNPVYLRSQADPQTAAMLERTAIEVDALVTAWQSLTQKYDIVLTEGCYGWLTPLAPGVTMQDFAQRLGVPVLLVLENRKGAASLAALTVKAIQDAGLTCAGIVLNHPGEEWDTAAVTNADLLENVTGVPVLASLIQGDEFDPELLETLFRA